MEDGRWKCFATIRFFGFRLCFAVRVHFHSGMVVSQILEAVLKKQIVAVQSMVRYESKPSFVFVAVVDSSNKVPLAERNIMELL